MVTARILFFVFFFTIFNLEALFVDISHSEPTRKCCGLFLKKPKKIYLKAFVSQDNVNYDVDGFFVKNEDDNTYRFLLKNGGELILLADWKEHSFVFKFSTDGFILSPYYVRCSILLNDNRYDALIDLAGKKIVCNDDRTRLFKLLNDDTQEEFVFNLLPSCEAKKSYRRRLENTDTYRL